MNEPTNDAPVMAELVEEARRIYRTLEMSAGIMRDPGRTGRWEGAERTARAFERQAIAAKALHDRLAALASARAADGPCAHESWEVDTAGQRTHCVDCREYLGPPPVAEVADAGKPIAPAGDGAKEVRRWSCQCDWIGCYTAQEIADHGEPTECPRCCCERIWEIEPALARPRAAVGEQQILDELIVQFGRDGITLTQEIYAPVSRAILALQSRPAKVVSLPGGDPDGAHMTHCYQGEYEGACKYGDDACPAGGAA